MFKFKKKKILQPQKTKTETYLSLDEQDESMLDHFALGDKMSLKILLNFSYPYRWKFLLSLTLLISSSLFALLSSKYMGNLIEEGLIQENQTKAFQFSALIIFFELFSMLFIWLGRKTLSFEASRVIYDIRKKLFNKLQNLPMSFYDRQPQGRIVTRVTHDVEGIEDFFTSGLGNMLSAFITTVLSVVAMLATDLKLGLIMAISIIPSIILTFITKNLLRDSNRRVSKFSSAINSKLSEFLSGIEVIRAFGLERFSKNKFDHSVDDYLHAQLRGNSLFAWSMPTVIFFASIPLIGLVYFGGKSVLAGTLSVGVFISFIRYYERFFNPMMLISREIHVVQQAFTSTERVMSFLNAPSEETELKNYGNLNINSLEGDIKFKSVSMGYNSESKILKEVNFHIQPGEKIGLVGRTGSGKSTTVSLLARLYEFQEGDILVDDIPIRNFDRHSLRNTIGFVSQDSIIFKGTLRENLTTRLDLSDQILFDASKKTGLIGAFNINGFNLDFEIFDGGVNLSVGQRQLISLTRVLLKNPSILILDEATANIDPYFEEIIHGAVMNIMAGRTCLIIAHRLDTLKECDRIFVFNQGQLVESGSLPELIDQEDYFYKLHFAQEIH